MKYKERFISWCMLVTFTFDHSRTIYSPLNFRFIQKTKNQICIYILYAVYNINNNYITKD